MNIENLNNKQQEAVLKTEGPLLVLAGAGSGKTKVLTTRIAYLIEEKHIDPYNILAITFTNKAAKEMKDRTYNLIGEQASSLQISTFHSFGLKIVRENCELLGYDHNFVIMDSDDSLTVVKKILKDINKDPKIYNPKAIRNKISSCKNELMSPESYEKFVASDYEKVILEVYQKYVKKLKNNNSIDLKIDFLIHSGFMKSVNDAVSARIFNDSLLQYSYDSTFAIFSDRKIAYKQLHNSKDNIRSGVIYGKDYIGMTNDSSIGYDLDVLKPGESKKICIYVYAKDNSKSGSFEDIANEIDKIRKIDSQKEFNVVKKFWEKYIEKYYNLKEKNYGDKVYDIYKRTILLFPLLTNQKTGGIIASMEMDENRQKSGGYRILLDKRCNICNKSFRFIRHV